MGLVSGVLGGPSAWRIGNGSAPVRARSAWDWHFECSKGISQQESGTVDGGCLRERHQPAPGTRPHLDWDCEADKMGCPTRVVSMIAGVEVAGNVLEERSRNATNFAEPPLPCRAPPAPQEKRTRFLCDRVSPWLNLK